MIKLIIEDTLLYDFTYKGYKWYVKGEFVYGHIQRYIVTIDNFELYD